MVPPHCMLAAIIEGPSRPFSMMWRVCPCGRPSGGRPAASLDPPFILTGRRDPAPGGDGQEGRGTQGRRVGGPRAGGSGDLSFPSGHNQPGGPAMYFLAGRTGRGWMQCIVQLLAVQCSGLPSPRPMYLRPTHCVSTQGSGLLPLLPGADHPEYGDFICPIVGRHCRM
jgi:hypothetical protein